MNEAEKIPGHFAGMFEVDYGDEGYSKQELLRIIVKEERALTASVAFAAIGWIVASFEFALIVKYLMGE